MNAEDKLHCAICNAVILLNNGEEIAPRVSAILRTALAEYNPTPQATTASGLVDVKTIAGGGAGVPGYGGVPIDPDDPELRQW